MIRIDIVIGSHIWTSSFFWLEIFDQVKVMSPVDL